jgi:hypothetical protein
VIDPARFVLCWIAGGYLAIGLFWLLGARRRR